MAETTTSRAAAIESISRAFAGVKREDGISLHEAQAIDGWAMEADQALARAIDTDASWEDVPSEDIEKGCNVLPYLDAKGFRYYIPAFMRWALENMDRSSSPTIEFTVYALTPYASDTTKYSLLSTSQAVAIAQFLAFIVDNWNDEVALDAFAYWTSRDEADS